MFGHFLQIEAPSFYKRTWHLPPEQGIGLFTGLEVETVLPQSEGRQACLFSKAIKTSPAEAKGRLAYHTLEIRVSCIPVALS